jgi:hypothetical protein
VGRFVQANELGGCGFDVEIVELNADGRGSIEANGLNDDSDGKLCSFARLPLRVDGDALFMGDAFACRYALRDELLLLSCEDHRTPPATLEDAVTLTRVPVVERRGLAALQGAWHPPAFWGGNSGDDGTFVIAADGALTAGKMRGRVTILSDDVLRLELDTVHEECRYRALDDKLTLACGKRAPARIDAGPRTLVFRRSSPR